MPVWFRRKMYVSVTWGRTLKPMDGHKQQLNLRKNIFKMEDRIVIKCSPNTTACVIGIAYMFENMCKDHTLTDVSALINM